MGAGIKAARVWVSMWHAVGCCLPAHLQAQPAPRKMHTKHAQLPSMRPLLPPVVAALCKPAAPLALALQQRGHKHYVGWQLRICPAEERAEW